MPSKKYWERRQVKDTYKVYQDAEKVADEIAKLYIQSSAYISKEIEGIFEKFKVKWGLSDQEARNLIAPMHSGADISDLMQRLANATQTDQVRELRAQIESSAYRSRISRLAELMRQIDTVMTNVYRQELAKTTAFFRNLARDAYYKSIFGIQQRVNAAFSFAHIDHKAIDKVLSMNWSGTHYSKRIWKNVQGLAQTIKQELMVGLITGKTERESANVISTRFAQGASKARRLVRTESNHVSTELNFMAYEDAGVEEYLYLATLDLRTSKICRELDGKIFKLSERKVGTNCPPMHPWCRSTTMAVIDRDLLKDLTRRARDPETGKTYTVPLTMNYKQWYKEYVEGYPEAERKKRPYEKPVEKQLSSDIIKSKEKHEVAEVHLVGKIDKTVYECVTKNIVTDEVVITDRQIRHIKDRHPDDYERFSKHFPQIVADPDYIIKDNRPDTAIILKEIKEDNERFYTVLRLCTSKEPKGYKNSIITFLKIDKKRWDRYLRKKEILYTKE